jgi:hypothetical protein
LIPASGDQDHTISLVRIGAARLATPPRPSHPASRFVTIGRNVPLDEGGMVKDKSQFLIISNQNIFTPKP